MRENTEKELCKNTPKRKINKDFLQLLGIMFLIVIAVLAIWTGFAMHKHMIRQIIYSEVKKTCLVEYHNISP